MRCRSTPPLFIRPVRGRPPAATTPTAPDPPPIQVADVNALSLEPGRCLRSRHAGVFLFLPLLAQLHWDRVIETAAYPGSRMVPAPCALLSLLTLKLLDKERLSHIDDFNCDEALGLFAGLNILPKKSFATDYSYRTTRAHQQRLLHEWMRPLSALLFPEADAFSLDFHPIGHRGEATELENHYQPRRGRAGPSVQTFFAAEHHSHVLCYANATLTRVQQPGEILRFIDFWQALTQRPPQWLYFDSKLTTYAELSQVNEKNIWFVTLRRRGSSLLKRLAALPVSAWQSAVIDIPKRRHQHIRYVDELIKLRGYQGEIRQIAAKGLGRENPTLFLSNHRDASVRELIMNYARRNGVEDALGSSVNFFHLDCLSSEVRLNVDLDTVLTVVANGCYRWLAGRLHGFDKAQPKQLYRKFVETAGAIKIQPGQQIVVYFDRRSHNPILRAAQLDNDCPPIPWLANHRLRFVFA